MIKKYKIFENLQQSKKILNDLDISETNEKYIKLRELLNKNLGYMGQFTKWLFKDNENFNKIEDTYKKLISINNLDKKIDDFDTLEDLYDYLQIFESNRTINQIINSLPSNTRKYVNEKLKKLLLLNIQYADSIKNFYKKKGGRYNENSSHWTKPKEFDTYEDWLYDATNIVIKNLAGDFNSETIKKKFDGLNIDIIEDRPDLLMVRVNDYNASKKLGSPHWCIVTSNSMWNHYVNDFTNQYFVWDFSKDISDKKRMFGTTVSPDGNISYAHWADDSKITDLSYIDNL